MNNFISRFPRWVGASTLATAAVFSSFTPHAHAKALPNISESCFTYSPGYEHPGANNLASTDFRAELKGTGLSLKIASLNLSDHNHHLDSKTLSRVNAAAAYGVLTAMNHGVSAQCANMPIPETDEVKEATPEASWSMTTLIRTGKRNIMIRDIHLKILDTSSGIHTQFDVSGLPTQQPLIPSKISGDFTFHPAARPPYQVEIHSLKSILAKSSIEGKGDMLIAPGIKNLEGNLHLSIGHISALIEQVGKVTPPQIPTALTVARFMGHSEGEHMTGWDLHMAEGKITVNGVSIPLPTKLQ